MEESASAAAEPAALDEMVRRLHGGADHVLVFERPDLQEEALAVIPHDRIASLTREVEERGHWRGRDAELKALMTWFKRDFFRWCQKPKCDTCGKGGKSVRGVGTAPPNEEERRGWASLVELYQVGAS